MRAIQYASVSLLIFLCIKGHSQTYNFRNYTIEEGLASNETYYSLQGKDGYLYISTDRGLQRFDGRRFQTIPFADHKLSGTTVFSIHEDPRGVIWISSYRKGLFYLYKDTLRSYPHNDKLLQLAGHSFIDQFFVEQNGDIYFSITNLANIIFRFRNNGILDSLVIPGNLMNPEIGNSKQIYFKGKHVFAKRNSFKSTFKETVGSLQTFPVKIKDDIKYQLFYPRGGPATLHGDSILVGVNKTLVLYSKQGEYINEYIFDDQVLSITVDSDNQILVATFNGFYFIKKDNKPEYYLPGYAISGITQDREGGYWITSTNKGLLYLASFDIHVLASGQRSSCVEVYKNHLVILDYAPSLKSYHYNSSQFIHDTALSIPYIYKDVFINDEILGIPFQTFSLKNFKLTGKLDSFPKFRKHASLNDTAILIACKSGAYSVSLNNLKQVHPLIDSSYFCHAIFANSNYIYIGTDNGLIQFFRKTKKYKKVFPDILYQLVTDIKALNSTTLIVSTKTNGVLLLHDSSYTHLTPDNSQLLSLSCTSIMVENNQTFWIGTDAGICRIEQNKTGFQSFNVDVWDGLLSQKVNDLAIIDKLLIVSTDAGVCYLNTEAVPSDSSSILLKPSIPHKSIDQQNGDTIRLKSGIRNLTLSLNTITFKHLQHLKFSYKVNGAESMYTNSNVLYLNNLSPGLNTVTVNVANSNGQWNKKPSELSILVPAYFYEKTLFQILALILIIALIMGLTYAYLAYTYRKKMQKWRFSTLQLRELNLQLNPHFIFNAINNIQHLAGSDKAGDMSSFVQSFSKLTRKVLDNSKFKVITLAEEIENIKEYVKLEKLRFKGQSFEFSLEISPEIDLKKELVPPMILQPCVENAIWHGLLPKENNRLLSLTVEAIADGFKIIVEDNGIGLNSSEKRKSHSNNKTSVGISNTRLRLKLYDEMELGRSEFEVMETYKHDGKPSGVKAWFIFLPNSKTQVVA